MSILVLGLNHNTASLTLRERLYFPLDKISLFLQDLLARDLAREAVLVSTCNRTELYCEADDVDALTAWFLERPQVSLEELNSALYVYENEAAVSHLMAVACGLDSLVWGESQILGQLKEAYSESCSAGTVSTLFHRLFQQVFGVAKDFRTSTAIGACPVSVASAAFQFAKQFLPENEPANIVLLGAGDTAQRLLRYLTTQLQFNIALVNRTLDKVVQLVRDRRVRTFPLHQLKEALRDADFVFTATASPTPLINVELMQQVMREREARPMTILDIAVPRDVDPAVKHLKVGRVFDVDDLRTIIDHNRQGRAHAEMKAHELFKEYSAKFIAEWTHRHHINETIRGYRHQVETLCRMELHKAKELLRAGHNPEAVLDVFAAAVTNKWLHAPSVHLREAGEQGRVDLLSFAKQLFTPLAECGIKSS